MQSGGVEAQSRRKQTDRAHAADADRADVVAARRGDQGAFARLYEKFAPIVHGALLTRLPAQYAEDLVHDAFVRALRRLHTLRDGEAFGAWLLAIARNAAADLIRRRPVVQALSDELPAPASLAAEAREALAAIRSLPEAYRETLILRLVEGMTGPEIAERTGLAPGSVRVNLHRGMHLLREKLGAPGEKG